jgi:hypothetical protein
MYPSAEKYVSPGIKGCPIDKVGEKMSQMMQTNLESLSID